jgi:hypothetical protein
MTTKIQALEQRIEQLTQILAQRGIFMPRATPATDKDRADYIEFGSPAHLVLLGLVEVEPGDEDIYITCESKGKTYRLEDEITAFVHCHDPKQVAALTLRQKISEFEAGRPTVPSFADAPLWTPEPMDGESWQQRQFAVTA